MPLIPPVTLEVIPAVPVPTVTLPPPEPKLKASMPAPVPAEMKAALPLLDTVTFWPPVDWAMRAMAEAAATKREDRSFMGDLSTGV